MKVLQTPVRFYPFIGGVEQYVYYVSRELARLDDCEVKVICANEASDVDVEVYDGINIRRLGYIGKVANTNITLSLPSTLYSEDFDIIHTHIPTPWSADWSNIIARIKHKPLVVTYHNDIIGENMADKIAKIYNKTALKLLLNKADRIIITQDDYIQSPHLENYKEKITTIPNGVDTQLFRPPQDKRTKNQIFFLSVLDKFHKYKGLDYLLEALTIVKEDIEDVQLVVGGKGELLEYYQEKTRKLHLEENVTFKGFLSDDDVKKYYAQSQLFVLPSISSLQEGFGIVLLEALSSKTPVVSTDIVGVAKDVTKTNSGIIVKPKNTSSLADAITDILLDEDQQKQMGENGRQLVEEKYEWKNISQRIHDLYEELL